MIDIFTYSGRRARSIVTELILFAAFLKTTMVEIALFFFRKQVAFIVLLRQILFTGVEALSLVFMIGLSIGGIIIIQGNSILDNFGQSQLVYRILILIITREVGPVLTAFLIIARSGTAISTELGNMVVSHEVEALDSIGISPVSYLVVPRVLGVIISLFCLSIYFNIAGLFGGFLVANFVQPLSFVDFITNLMSTLTIADIVISQVKSLTFGFLIALIACYQGLKVNFARTEVPIRAIKAVVYSLTWVFIFDIIITIISYSM
jgi:phospholipid/cholesterol/gamma-HCH transport system permease protein